MATLHFDTDAGRGTANVINSACSNLEGELNNLNSRVNSMVGAEWIGNSANQFQSEFQNWSQQLRSCVEQLTTLRMRLENEIAEWETAAQGLA